MQFWQMINITKMSKQVLSRQKMVSFPPIQQLIQKYNRNSSSHQRIHSQGLSQDKNLSSFGSKLSSASLKSSQKSRMYINKSPAFYKKKSNSDANSQKLFRISQQLKSSNDAKRGVDRQHVIDTYLKNLDVRKNPRLLQRGSNILRMSQYDNFDPFRKNHQIKRHIPKIVIPNPQQKTKKSSQK